jgi:hypothetical protein
MRTVLAMILGGSLLAGCGGGGGSSGGSAPPPATLLAINAGNQDAVGRASVRASTAMLGAGGGATATANNASLRYAAGVGSVHRAAPLGSLASVVAGVLMDLNNTRRGVLAEGRTPLTMRSLAVAPITSQCDFGGSLTISVGDTNNDQDLSVGETMTLTFNQCYVTATDFATGAMAITMSSISLSNNLIAFGGAMSINQFSVSDGTRSATLNGGVTLSFAMRSTTVTDITMSVTGAGMSATVAGGGSSDTVTFEPGFAMTDTATSVVGGIGHDSATISGSFSATSLAGRVTLETPTPLVQMDNEDFPRSGALRVVGNGSAMRMTVIDASTVQVELDANLDGTYEASKNVPWTTLLPG